MLTIFASFAFLAPLTCAILPFLILIALKVGWFDFALVPEDINPVEMTSKSPKFNFKKKESSKVATSEVIQLSDDSSSDLEDFDLELLKTDNTDSDNDFKKKPSMTSKMSERRKVDKDNWKNFMEQARKPKLSPEKKKEAQDQWKGLMSTMQKNQATSEVKKKSSKRQINVKKAVTNSVTKRSKVEEARTVVTTQETKVVVDISKEEEVKPAVPLHPMFVKSTSKSNLPVENEENEVKPWDLVHSDNPWLCGVDDGSEADPVVVSLNEVPATTEGPEKTKSCPFYKKLPGTKFSVDAFNYGVIPGIDVYLLSHFHLDHYQGLTRKFSKTLVCSVPTANLVKMKLGVEDHCIRKLNLNKVYMIQGIQVVLIDANHCPGSVLFLLKLPNGLTYLHTGDFRFTPEMFTNKFLQNLRVDCLYLDTTYCDPRYTFPTQAEAISHAISEIKKHLAYRPKTLVACGTYCIGKERVFGAIADSLGSKVFCGYEKRRVIGALENPYFQNMLSAQENECQVHVLSMQHLNQKFLSEYLAQRPQYTNMFVVRPTGWEFSKPSKGVKAGANLRTMANDTITLLGIPYSEHSSFSELQHFVSTLKPRRVQPTVNVGNATKRESMMTHIDSWLGSSSS